MKFTALVSILISVIRNFITDEVVIAIKNAILQWSAAAEDGWQEGERTNFVIAKAREVAATTPSTIDDLIVEVLARLYIAYFVANGKAPAAPVQG